MATPIIVYLMSSFLPCLLAQQPLNIGAGITGISAFPESGSSLFNLTPPKLPSPTNPVKLPQYPQPALPQPYPNQNVYPQNPGALSPLQNQLPSVNYGQPTPYQPGINPSPSPANNNDRLLKALGLNPAGGKAGSSVLPNAGLTYGLPKKDFPLLPSSPQSLPLQPRPQNVQSNEYMNQRLLMALGLHPDQKKKVGYVEPRQSSYLPQTAAYVPAKSTQPTNPYYDVPIYKGPSPVAPSRPTLPYPGQKLIKEREVCYPHKSQCTNYRHQCECRECGHYGCYNFCC